MSETPLPCPFCGHVGLTFSEGSTFRWRIAECEECYATCGEERIQTLGDGTKEEWEQSCRSRLIAAWNRRAAPAIKQTPYGPAERMDVAMDAERYRWLRAGNYHIHFARAVLNDTPHGIDAAIDAAMRQEKAE